jgi:hypothetical protein
MTFNEDLNDQVLSMVANLKTDDVSPRHTHQLRRRCHAMLKAEPERHAPVDVTNPTQFGRVIGPALGVAWCLAYLVEVIRRSAGILDF